MFDRIYVACMSFEELLALFQCEVADDDDFYAVLAYNIAQSNRQQFEEMLQDLSGTRLRAAIFGLGTSAGLDHSSGDLIFRYIDHSDVLVAAEAIDALRRMGLADWPQIEPALRHQSAYVRGAALRFAKAKLGAGAKPILVEGLQDADPIVRQNALDELEEIIAPQDIPLITPYLNDTSADVRQAARTLLESME